MTSPESNKKLVKLNCWGCGEEFQGEEPKMCCSGHMCGCLGMPIDPIICSEECYKLFLEKLKNGRNATIQ